MENKGKFNGTSFKFNSNEDIPEYLSSFCEKDQEGYDVLYNNSGLLFLEDIFISNSNYFIRIVKKLKKKKYDSNLKIYKANKVIEIDNIEVYAEEINLYKKIIDENNINGFAKNDINISVKLLKKYYPDIETRKTIDICVLLLIANVTDFNDNSFVFKVRSNTAETSEIIDFTSSNIPDLFFFYEWIMVSKENQATRLRIVREIILDKQSFYLSKTDLDNAKSIFNRIIKEETDKYFEQVNILKSDFFKLSEIKTKNYHSLHLKFIGWCSTIAIFIYDSLKEQSGNNLYHKMFFSSNEKINLFLVIFMMSLVVIWCIFLKEMKDYDNEYKQIKDTYTNRFFFESNVIEDFLPAPKILIVYRIIFIILLLLLLLRLVIPLMKVI
ncbi:hypothetical protein [Enterococcus casseliflavus]|uniref:hypothetical protein n=1 Tax=Enterococcus casseliflavus TaxID=37734 RepID=UPI0039A782DE